jgi:uncharacterized protein YodC (DUF2158 family)
LIASTEVGSNDQGAKDEIMPFKIGEVVKVKSGGPLMTVTGPNAFAGGKAVVSCIWFDGTNPRAGAFPAETLELSTAPQSARPIR